MKQNEIKHLLPAMMQRSALEGNPLSAMLAVMETLHAPAEEELVALDANFDPRRAPERFVPFLAHWMDLDRIGEKPRTEAADVRSTTLPTGVGRQRELVAMAAFLSQWRGTAKGLLLFLETATGVRGFEIDERVPGPDGSPHPFHFRLRVPIEALAVRKLIERIVESEKPAYVTCEIAYPGAGKGDP